MGAGKYFALDVLLLVILTSLVVMAFGLKRIAFLGELVIVLVLIAVSFIALIGIYQESNWGYGLMSILFGVILLDILFVFYLTNKIDMPFVIGILATAIGLILTITGIQKPHVTTAYMPGKYIASKTGTTYHIPKCDWAKKIRKQNRVWFADEEEAKKRFKAHSCI